MQLSRSSICMLTCSCLRVTQAMAYCIRALPADTRWMMPTAGTPHGKISNQLQHESISAIKAPLKSHTTRSHDMLTIRRNGCDGISHGNLKKHNRNRKDTVESKLCKSVVKCPTIRARQEQSRTSQRKPRPCGRIVSTVAQRVKHQRNHRLKQDRDKPSSGVGTVVVLPHH